jgi:hypothetical protein
VVKASKCMIRPLDLSVSSCRKDTKSSVVIPIFGCTGSWNMVPELRRITLWQLVRVCTVRVGVNTRWWILDNEGYVQAK